MRVGHEKRISINSAANKHTEKNVRRANLGVFLNGHSNRRDHARYFPCVLVCILEQCQRGESSRHFPCVLVLPCGHCPACVGGTTSTGATVRTGRSLPRVRGGDDAFYELLCGHGVIAPRAWGGRRNAPARAPGGTSLPRVRGGDGPRWYTLGQQCRHCPACVGGGLPGVARNGCLRHCPACVGGGLGRCLWWRACSPLPRVRGGGTRSNTPPAVDSRGGGWVYQHSRAGRARQGFSPLRAAWGGCGTGLLAAAPGTEQRVVPAPAIGDARESGGGLPGGWSASVECRRRMGGPWPRAGFACISPRFAHTLPHAVPWGSGAIPGGAVAARNPRRREWGSAPVIRPERAMPVGYRPHICCRTPFRRPLLPRRVPVICHGGEHDKHQPRNGLQARH